ncbi:hypothetical protein O3Q52_47465 [Streptomyces sp. ActVer]|nr:hypothetical protein [Streptomyces sp. ActVer]MCZ4515624.1 hypothetical protein [Streptomyces sp. ActVer]
MAATAATPMVIGPRAGGVAVCQVGEGTGDRDEGQTEQDENEQGVPG